MSEVKPISMKEGRAFKNGVEISSMMKLQVLAQPEVTSFRRSGQRNMSHKVTGIEIAGTITQYKVTQELADIVTNYLENGVFDQFTISGIQFDPASDFEDNVGSPDRITITGVQLTGDIPVLDIDSEGELVMEELSFLAYSVRKG